MLRCLIDHVALEATTYFWLGFFLSNFFVLDSVSYVVIEPMTTRSVTNCYLFISQIVNQFEFAYNMEMLLTAVGDDHNIDPSPSCIVAGSLAGERWNAFDRMDLLLSSKGKLAKESLMHPNPRSS